MSLLLFVIVVVFSVSRANTSPEPIFKAIVSGLSRSAIACEARKGVNVAFALLPYVVAFSFIVQGYRDLPSSLCSLPKRRGCACKRVCFCISPVSPICCVHGKQVNYQFYTSPEDTVVGSDSVRWTRWMSEIYHPHAVHSSTWYTVLEAVNFC